MFWISAFLTGFFGSFHCVGMCGTIALALPGHQSNWGTFFLGRLLYNSGRVTTYMFLGLLSGLLGTTLKLAGMQQSISIIAGIILIFFALFRWMDSVQWFNTSFLFQSGFFKKNLTSDTISAKYIVGIFNGFLPCGFVYMSMVSATITQQWLDAVIYMFLFGLGTFPLMLLLAISGKIWSVSLRKKLNKISGYFILALGFLFILRGLNLGIPYVSPVLHSTSPTDSTMLCAPAH